MCDNKDKRPRQPQSDKVLFECESVASATECTGMLAFSAATSEETGAYGDIYDVPLPVITAAENPEITGKSVVNRRDSSVDEE